MQQVCLEAAEAGLLASAHDCADGGLAITVAECCILGNVGADIQLTANCAPAAALFAETQSRIVVSLAAENLSALREIVDECRVECTILGKTGGNGMRITVNDVEVVGVAVEDLDSCWRNAIPEKMAETGVE